MATGPKDACRAAAASILGASVTLPAPYAAVPCPVRSGPGRPGQAEVFVRLGPMIPTRTTVGYEVLMQVDVFGYDATGHLADVAVGHVAKLLTQRPKVEGSIWPPQAPFVFTEVREDVSPTMEEQGPNKEHVTHNILQLRVRVQDTSRSPGRF